MFVRRSGRLNQGNNSNRSPNAVRQNINPYSTQQSQHQNNAEQQQFPQQRYFNSPQIQECILNVKNNTSPERVEEPELKILIKESPEKNASATTKALNQMETESAEKKKWKKGGKTPMALRRKKLNQRLSKMLTPKSALILMHELKPGCVYKVQEQPGCIPPSFCAQVEHDSVVLGTGQGLSKSQAKNCAAENAIKTIVCRTMSRHSANASVETDRGEMSEDDQEDTPENLPWAGLASFAIYKMFSEWQTQGADLLSIPRPIAKPKPKPPTVVNAPIKKELPPNAGELHPAVVLNMMHPGLTAVEIEREEGPKCRVKMGYTVDGQMYTGIGGNKKDAKKEAAKAVLEGHYGLTYP